MIHKYNEIASFQYSQDLVRIYRALFRTHRALSTSPSGKRHGMHGQVLSHFRMHRAFLKTHLALFRILRAVCRESTKLFSKCAGPFDRMGSFVSMQASFGSIWVSLGNI